MHRRGAPGHVEWRAQATGRPSLGQQLTPLRPKYDEKTQEVMLERAGLPQVTPLPLAPSLARWVASLGLISGHSLPCPRLWMESHHQHPGASGSWVTSPFPQPRPPSSASCAHSALSSPRTPQMPYCRQSLSIHWASLWSPSSVPRTSVL